MRQAMKRLNLKATSERGQSSTEYMLLVSVVVIAIIAAAYAFVPTFKTGVYDLSKDVSEILVKHGSVKGGWGLAANDNSGGGIDTTAAQASRGAAPATGSYDPNANAGE